MNVIDNVITEIEKQLTLENSQQVLNLSKALYWLSLADKVQGQVVSHGEIEILPGIKSIALDTNGNIIDTVYHDQVEIEGFTY